MPVLTAQAFCKNVVSHILDNLADPLVHDGLSSDRDRSSPERRRRQRQSHDSILCCDEAHTVLLREQCRSILDTGPGITRQIIERLDDLLKVAYDQFYACPFKDVPECWRRLYTDASILKACVVVLREDWTDWDKAVMLAEDEKRGKDDEWHEHGEAGTLQACLYELRLSSVVRTLDMAIIMAGAAGRKRREWIERLLSLFQEQAEAADDESQKRSCKRRKVEATRDEFPVATTFVPPICHPIEKQSIPPLDSFEKRMHCPRDPHLGPMPLVITDAIEHWPARSERPWKSPRYLLSKTLGGRRLVPVEVGRSYVDEGWGQKIISFKEFLDDYLMIPSNELLQHMRRMTREIEIEINTGHGEEDNHNKCHDNEVSDTRVEEVQEEEDEEPAVGYLAQHDLFTQIPSLRADICIPDYCYSTPTPPHRSSPLAAKHAANAELETPLLNAWFGPAGTISPLHVDPYHNILAQVVGRKYVRLYAPRETTKMYPRGMEGEGINMENTSQVDVGLWEGWDSGKENMEEERKTFPEFARAEYVDCVLDAGDCLYIPVGWWHYVRSVSVSFSVSFWWN